MTPVYQTIIDPGAGNCMQAAVASLLSLNLDDVPHFRVMGKDEWFQALVELLNTHGFDYAGLWLNPRDLGSMGVDTPIRDMSPGVNGYYYAAVYSPRYFDPHDFMKKDIQPITHAVIIDADFNIVHDPNPEYKGWKEYPLAHRIGKNGVKYAYLIEPLNTNP
jgi:hypothetical protein